MSVRKPKFELYLDSIGEYRFRLKAKNGENIGKSEGYTVKHNAVNGIASVQNNCTDIENFDVFKSDANDEYYFNLLSKDNGQVILSSSEGYKTSQGAEAGVISVKENAPEAITVDFTKGD